MTVILIMFLAFLVPVAIYLLRESRLSRAKEVRAGLVPGKKESFSVSAAARAFAVMVMAAVPVYWLSDQPYSYYHDDSGVLKIAFKHSGTRVSDCEEADLIKREGERYRQQLKDTKQVKMNIEKLARCPRERHPVMVELFIDGRLVLDKSYAPTGIKKDMASYIYDEFPVSPGPHALRMHLYDTGAKAAPVYTYDGTTQVGPREVKVIWLSDREGALVMD